MKIEKNLAGSFASSVRYSKEGLVPVAVVSSRSRGLLMLGYANAEALVNTLTSGFAWFYSRSRKRLWKKGGESGNFMEVGGVLLDCDSDAICYEVEVQGKGLSCHLGRESCFELKAGKEKFSLPELAGIIEERALKPNAGSYTAKLLSDRKLACEKIEEESAELVEALQRKNRKEVAWEACDLIYHTLVAARGRGATLSDLEREFARRRK